MNYKVRIIDRLLRFDTTTDDVIATLLPFAQTPNASFEFHKITIGDGHTVTIRVDPATADFLLPDGSTGIVLDDEKPSVWIKIPALGQSPAFITSGGTGGGGGTTIPPDAPPCVIGTASVREVYDGFFEVTVPWTAGVGAPTVGISVFVEDPDISAAQPAPMNATVPLDATSGLSGKWSPTRLTDDFESPVVMKVKSQAKARDIRVYLQAFGSVRNATLVRANKPTPTPNVVVPIPAAAGAYVSGQEFAWIVTNESVVLVPDFDNPNGPKYHLTFSYTPPDDTLPLPPGLRPFGGVQIKYEHDDNPKPTQGPLLEVGHQDDWRSGDYDAYAGHFKCWFCSRDVDGNVNNIVKGVTPMKEVTVVYPPEGEASAPYITDFVLTNPRYDSMADYTILQLADLSWTAPDSPRFAQVRFYRTGVTPPRHFPQDSGKLVHATTLQVIDWSKTTEDWTIVAISVDYNGKESDDPAAPKPSTPRVVWHMVPPSADSLATGVIGITGVNITTEQEQNSDGIVMMRHKISGWTNPTDNTFGGASIARVFGSDIANGTVMYWNVPKNDTTFVTDWEPAPGARTWMFYFVSRDGQDRRNPIVPGVTPSKSHDFVPITGSVIPSRIPGSWWNPAEFDWPTGAAGKFTALEFVAKKIFVGSILRVGGGNATGSTDPTFKGQENGQIAVYNSANTMRAWMGEHLSGSPDNVANHSVFGGWFAELYIGGDSPVNAPIYATQTGKVIIGGFDFSGTSYPYLSVKDSTGNEVGRLGARIGWTQASGAEATIHGAWFKELACGGTSFSDWRMLAKMDATKPDGASVTVRNVNSFIIDYQPNVSNPIGNPSNAAYRLEFGMDAYVADVSGDTRYWKFPGIKILRTGTTHGSVLINRGLVLKSPIGNVTRAALVTYNGDSFGSDTANGGVFWADFTLISPSSNSINVQLSSGSAGGNGSSYFFLKDSGGIVNFQVDQAGAATIRSTLTIGGNINGSGLVLSGGINCSGPITTNSQSITCGALNTGGFNISCATLVCTNVNATLQLNANTLVLSGGINCSGQLTTNGQAIFCGVVNAGSSNGNFGWLYINGVTALGLTGQSGSFTSANGKTITVTNGIITGIT